MVKEITEILETKEEKEIKDLIYNFRGKEVMLDSDIARLFNIETKNLNKAMKRNLNRFPSDFCFQLNSKELHSQRFQNGTANHLSFRRYNPYVYTEQGIIALAGVLKSEVADEMSVKISRVFVKMRHALITYAEPLKYISQIHGEVIEFKDFAIKNFDEIFNRIEKLEPKKEALFLNGQWFDSAKAMIKLVERAKESIVLVDPYGDHAALAHLSHRNDGVKLTLYKSEFSKLKDIEIEAFRKQYGELTIKPHDATHNRYLILDSDEVYDLGTSPNHMGNKIFDITKIREDDVRKALIELFR